jgi:carboxypeptidase C (cathepsin A)
MQSVEPQWARKKQPESQPRPEFPIFSRFNHISMKKSLLFLFAIATLQSTAQKLSIPSDTSITSYKTGTFNGSQMTYAVETGMQPVWNQKGDPIASLSYFYYHKHSGPKDSKSGSSEHTARPLVFSFNGGPGSASVWMHLAYTGPKVLNIDEEGYPIQPYGYKDNPHSILDVADIVYVDPVNTGYSRMIPDAEGKMPDKKNFFGINADVKYLAEWMNTFVSRHQRWESPKYIVGESYGGTRVMGLAAELQDNQWMYLNGVIMVSPADYRVLRSGNPVGQALNLPYFTAVSWYHKKLNPELQNRDLLEILPEVEQFSMNTLLPALALGSGLSPSSESEIAEKMAYYSGVDKEVFLQYHLRVPTRYFWKELLRDEAYTLGRLDSRYLGIDKYEAGESPDHNIELSSWLHSFTPAINQYIREELKFETDVKYNIFGDVSPWDRSNDNVREGLRSAMAQNPFLNVLCQSGYYDGATTYSQAKYTLSQIDPSGKMKDRIHFRGYRSGHMMYLRSEDLVKANNDLREFILNTYLKGVPAKYERSITE